MLLPELRSSRSGNEPFRLRSESRAAQGRKETAEDHEEILEEAEEGAEQDVQEQPEEYALPEEAVLIQLARNSVESTQRDLI